MPAENEGPFFDFPWQKPGDLLTYLTENSQFRQWLSSREEQALSYITILPRTIIPAWPPRIKYVNNSNAQRRKKEVIYLLWKKKNDGSNYHETKDRICSSRYSGLVQLLGKSSCKYDPLRVSDYKVSLLTKWRRASHYSGSKILSKISHLLPCEPERRNSRVSPAFCSFRIKEVRLNVNEEAVKYSLKQSPCDFDEPLTS